MKKIDADFFFLVQKRKIVKEIRTANTKIKKPKLKKNKASMINVT